MKNIKLLVVSFVCCIGIITLSVGYGFWTDRTQIEGKATMLIHCSVNHDITPTPTPTPSPTPTPTPTPTTPPVSECDPIDNTNTIKPDAIVIPEEEISSPSGNSTLEDDLGKAEAVVIQGEGLPIQQSIEEITEATAQTSEANRKDAAANKEEITNSDASANKEEITDFDASATNKAETSDPAIPAANNAETSDSCTPAATGTEVPLE